MKRVFVAGPYSADNVLGVLRNIRRGIRISEKLFSLGFAPFCPWLDHQYEFIADHSKQEYYDRSMAWLEVSDAIFVLPGWDGSEGARNEVKRAVELNIPFFTDWTDLVKWGMNR